MRGQKVPAEVINGSSHVQLQTVHTEVVLSKSRAVQRISSIDL